MFHLGELYRRGVGVAQNASMAETWLRRAATRGISRPGSSLVQLFRSGAEADLNTAAVLCRQAADLGDGEAQHLLGQLYLAGEGVPRDPTEAARWLAKAADQNVTAAYDRLGALYARRVRACRRTSRLRRIGFIVPRAHGDAQRALPSRHAAAGWAGRAARSARRPPLVPQRGAARERCGQPAARHSVCHGTKRAP